MNFSLRTTEVVMIKVTGVTKVMVAETKAMVGTVAAAGTAGEIVTAAMMTDGVTVAETVIEVILLKNQCNIFVKK